MGRAPRCDKSGLKKGPWTPEEDQKLIDYIQKHGHGNWRTLPKNAGLQRYGDSCRLRWTNYLKPDIKRGQFSFEEEKTIIQLHSTLGNKTRNEIKNYWNTHIRKRPLRASDDVVATEQPEAGGSSSSHEVLATTSGVIGPPTKWPKDKRGRGKIGAQAAAETLMQMRDESRRRFVWFPTHPRSRRTIHQETKNGP